MNISFSFHKLQHSDALESHAREKLAKIKALFKNEDDHPIQLSVFFNAESSHGPHHHVEIKANIGRIHETTHASDTDMYRAFDAACAKMVTLVKKGKEKTGMTKHRVETEKTSFAK